MSGGKKEVKVEQTSPERQAAFAKLQELAEKMVALAQELENVEVVNCQLVHWPTRTSVEFSLLREPPKPPSTSH